MNHIDVFGQREISERLKLGLRVSLCSSPTLLQNYFSGEQTLTIWSLMVAAMFWHSSRCSKRLSGGTAGLVKRRHTKESSGPGSCRKKGTVMREATSWCQLVAEGHSTASLADQYQLYHSSGRFLHSAANLERWKWKPFCKVMML